MHGSDRIARAEFRNRDTGAPITDGSVVFYITAPDGQVLLQAAGTHMGGGAYRARFPAEDADAVLALGRPYRLLAVLDSPTAGQCTAPWEWVERYG